jgi:hypothetical protein
MRARPARGLSNHRRSEEPARYFGVERRIFLEPAFVALAVIGALAEPEAKHIVRMVVCHGDKC